jgi:membrane protein YdbS with pleckstrin-like domain
MDSTPRQPNDAATGADAPALDTPPGLLRQDPGVVGLQRTIGWLLTATIAGTTLVVAVVAVYLGDLSDRLALVAALAWSAGSGLLAWHLHRWPAVRYRHVAYRVDTRGLEIRRGVVWRRVLTVPRSRIQHTDVSQGPLERERGLATLFVHTAGTDYERLELDGLNHAEALRLRDLLLAPANDDGG